jgi:hypothetical protein
LSAAVDKFHVVRSSSRPITSITYEGNGSGGILRVNDIELTLNQVELGGAQPSFGTTKDGQLALSFRGKVFPFGPATSETDKLAVTNVPNGDAATISIEHSPLPWANYFEVNFMTGNSPKWKRYTYCKLNWTKHAGAKLQMMWRYEQFFYANNGWVEAFMTRPDATGLIRVEISEAAR